jgi:hypothetical protein
MDVCLLCLYVVLSCVGRGLCDGLIIRPEESYRVSNSVWLRNLKGGGQGPIWAVKPLDGWILVIGQFALVETSRRSYVRLPVLTVSSRKMAVFWFVTPCSIVWIDWRFIGVCCLPHQGDYQPDNRGGKNLQNVGQFKRHYTAQQPRGKQPSLFQSTWGVQQFWTFQEMRRRLCIYFEVVLLMSLVSFMSLWFSCKDSFLRLPTPSQQLLNIGRCKFKTSESCNPKP